MQRQGRRVHLHHQPARRRRFGERVPYVVAAIDLDEGVRMMANIVDSPPEAVRIGSRVRVCFERVSDDIALPQFTLDG